MAAKHDMNATVSAHNLPLASPPKRSRLDIFGASDASALKAASWHASASIAQDVEELHGRQAFTEDCGVANGCLSTVGSLESRSALERTAAVGASPLRRKAGGVTGVKQGGETPAALEYTDALGVELGVRQGAFAAAPGTSLAESVAAAEARWRCAWSASLFGDGGRQPACISEDWAVNICCEPCTCS